jgi:hypothetical protein
MQMSSEVENFKKLKREQLEARAWAELLGKEYTGGGGGIGYLYNCNLATEDLSTPTIYHQAYNGAKNYHGAPRDFLRHLEKAISQKFEELLAMALVHQDNELKEAAQKAVEVHEKLLHEAGLMA